MKSANIFPVNLVAISQALSEK